MRSSKCLLSTAGALYHIFIAPVEQSQFQSFRSSARCLASTNILPSKILSCSQRRGYAAPLVPTPKEPPKRRLPRDDEIMSWSVALVDGEGKLEEPRPTRAVLASIDRKEWSLVVVEPGEPGEPPVCKIMNKKEMREAAKAKAKSNRNPAATTKTIELNWAIAANDLEHRLKKFKEFLEKGFRIEVEIASKRRGRQATEEEADSLLKSIREIIKEVDGSKESPPMVGKLLGRATLFAVGKVPSK